MIETARAVEKARLAMRVLPLREAREVAGSPHLWREMLRTRLYANSVCLMANSVVGAALGIVFWTSVARLYPSGVVGVASALISAAGLIAYVAGLGLGTGLIRFLPSAGRGAGGLVNSCFTLAGVAAIALGALFVVGVPLWSPALAPVREHPVFAMAFVAFVAAHTIYALMGQVFIGLRRADLVLASDTLQMVLKVAMVFWLARLFSLFGIFASWGLAVSVVLALGTLVVLPRLFPGYRPLPSLRHRTSDGMVGFALANYLATGLWSAPGWVLPILVVNQVGSEANAYFFISWGLAALLFAIPGAVATSLFAEGSHQEEHLARDVRRGLALIGVMLLPAIALLLLLGDRLLLLFGQGYSAEGTRVLWALAPSAIPVAVNVVYLGIARVRKRLRDVVLLTSATAVGTLALGFALIPPLGILGPAVGWLISQSLVALFVLPAILRVLRSEAPLAVVGSGAR